MYVIKSATLLQLQALATVWRRTTYLCHCQVSTKINLPSITHHSLTLFFYILINNKRVNSELETTLNQSIKKKRFNFSSNSSRP